MPRRRRNPRPFRRHDRRLWRAISVALLAILFGTFGYMIIEGWDFWRSLFFTLITITTVGYGDYGLSEYGERFTSILIILGVGCGTYAAGTVVQVIVEYHACWERKMNDEIRRLRDHFIICGLGRIGRAVCANLAEADVPFVAIDSNRAAVEAAADLGHHAMIGDATDDDTLRAAGIDHARGIACLTPSDPENIVITLSARALAPELFIISRAEQEDSDRKLERAGVSRVISPIRAGGTSIATTIQKPHLADFLDQCDGHHGVALGQVEIAPGSPYDGQPLRVCGSAHDGVIFVALRRDGEGIRMRPRIDETIRAGDVLIIAGADDAVRDLRADVGARRAA